MEDKVFKTPINAVNEMVDEKSWDEFRNSGLLWWVNMILHTFGWSIVIESTDGELCRVYPARVKFRGFNEKNNTDGYIKVSKYLEENIKQILEESKE